jgi:hypothetical protein
MIAGEPNREPNCSAFLMAEAKTNRRGHGEDAISFDAAKNRQSGRARRQSVRGADRVVGLDNVRVDIMQSC